MGKDNNRSETLAIVGIVLSVASLIVGIISAVLTVILT